ncbi:hypothetical protein CU097_004957 [Rhizopus azygosporus]|uniref:Transmembrane protein n=1 Tax=Rhizopus azygosporus TaxID=86630 RepID=A0A367JXF4_RHIAZ|nr:hypothetical protein CU097_004957 [Rhizopus azygosporus]CEG72531.1 hypothetical protein RMATCC62417_08076 [Rhizopus microsporus]CEI94701.1 hypothetical protein RMCBS344292_08906 [Rhizopus microsporus]
MLRTGIGRSARGFNTFALQKRYTSSQQGPVTIYTGPMANVAKKLKLFSITSLGLGVGISPFVFVIDVPVPFVAKAALVGAAVATSAASTGLIQWVMSPYVTKITVPKQPEEGQVPKELTIHTLSFTARDHTTTVPVDTIAPASRIFTTWMITDPSQAVGRIGEKTAKPKSLLYIHPELCQEEGVMKDIIEKTGIGQGF